MARKSAKKTKGVVRILNCRPSPDQEDDWRFEDAMEAEVLAAPVAAIPESKDLRDNSWWKINDQKSTGSCVGWATVDSVVRWHMVKADWVPKAKLLSPRFAWMASKETDEFSTRPTTFIEAEGTSLKAALDIARKFGNVFDAVLPFGTNQLYPGEAKAFYALAAKLKIASYFNLSTSLNPGVRLQRWRTWLATQGPILTRLSVDQTWDEATENDGELETYLPATSRGGHAIALVGYKPGRFIVRNSWGTAWGDKGYAYASIAYAEAAFTEAYGISL